MASSSSNARGCRGWRVDPHAESWQAELGRHDLYDLDGGGNWTAEDCYNATVKLDGMPSYGELCSVEGAQPIVASCVAMADTIQNQYGRLYMGAKSCVRSMVCDMDGGLEQFGGACRACHALSANEAFCKRVVRRAAVDGAMETKTNLSYLTDGQKSARLADRRVEAFVAARDASTATLKAIEEQNARSDAKQQASLLSALTSVQALFSELSAAAASASEAERLEAQARVDSAEAAQRKTEASACVSLMDASLKLATMQEALEQERAARFASEAASLVASSASSKLYLDYQAVVAEREHMAAMAAVRQAAKLHSARQADADMFLAELAEQKRRAEVEANLAQARHEQEQSELSLKYLDERAKLDASMIDNASVLLDGMEAQHQAQLADSVWRLDRMEAHHQAQLADSAWRLEESVRASTAALAASEMAHERAMAKLSANYTRAVEQANATADARVAAERVAHTAELDALPPIVQNLMTAARSGNLDKHKETTDILTDISTCLASGSKRGRMLSNASKTFYGILLNSGSPYAHKFVSNVLFGESLRESKRARSAFEHGLHEEGLVECCLESLRDVQLKPYGLESVRPSLELNIHTTD